MIVYDSECHACIIDGLRLHIGKRFVYPHNNIENLKDQLERATKIVKETGGGILVITEGVFGMSGNMGALSSIVELKKDYNFRLFVDDAHGFGTMGKTGAGCGEEQGVQDEIDLFFSTFAKSMASIGAFVSGNADIIDNLRYKIRSQIFAKSLPMPLVVGNIKRLSLIKNSPEFKNKLWEIVNAIQSILKPNRPLLGKTALVTAGPTREPIDPVRFIANRSSGKQGYSIAEALAAAGAETTLVTGPTNLPVPSGVRILKVETADEMLAHCMESLPVDIAVCAAAVADWKVANKSDQKIKKQKNINYETLSLSQNPDILKTLSNADNNRPDLVIGFAAETEDILHNGMRKQKEKNCDWILANDVAMGTQTFGVDHIAIHFISKKETEEWPVMKKEDVARYLAKKIIDEIGRV